MCVCVHKIYVCIFYTQYVLLRRPFANFNYPKWWILKSDDREARTRLDRLKNSIEICAVVEETRRYCVEVGRIQAAVQKGWCRWWYLDAKRMWRRVRLVEQRKTVKYGRARGLLDWPEWERRGVIHHPGRGPLLPSPQCTWRGVENIKLVKI